MLVYTTQDYWVFGLCSFFSTLKNTTFWKMDMFASTSEGVGDTLLGLLERAHLSHLCRNGISAFWWTQQCRYLLPPYLHHWFRLSLSNGSNRGSVSHLLTEDESRSSFWFHFDISTSINLWSLDFPLEISPFYFRGTWISKFHPLHFFPSSQFLHECS